MLVAAAERAEPIATGEVLEGTDPAVWLIVETITCRTAP